MEANKISQIMHDVQRLVINHAIIAVGHVRRLPWQRIAIASAISLGAVVAAYTAIFFWPKTVQLSYANSICFANPVVLPGLVKTEASPTYDVRMDHTLTIGNMPLFSSSTCLVPHQAPQPNTTETVYLAPLANGLFKKNVTVKTAELPVVTAAIALEEPVSIKDSLLFNLDQSDELFTYRLNANNASTDCAPGAENALACDLAPLALVQGTTYDLQLERVFKEELIGTVFAGSITTVAPLEVTATTINPGQTVYTAPTNLAITFNKAVGNYDGVKLAAGDQEVAITHKLTSETTLEITFTQPLPRSAQFKLTLGEATAKDRGYLTAPYVLDFVTSGGPKVAGINIGSYKVATSASITITFDSNLAGGQNLAHYVRVERAEGQMEAIYSQRGNTVTIMPKGGIPRCTPFTIRVLDGLKNDAGISGGSGTWIYSSRTVCQTTFSIGSSVNGRSITAYKFGTGSETIVFVGALHGNERSSANILNSLINYLEATPSSVPAHRTVVIIPIANPDGYAAGTRMNARSVDPNRNFPTSNWQAEVTQPNGQYYPAGGGTAPLSEPEAAALHGYISAVQPRLIMSYHAVARIVSANEVGSSLALAQTYGQKSGYPVYGNDTGGTFDYAITGAFEDWAREVGRACILVELANRTGNEFNSHRAAILSMIQS